MSIFDDEPRLPTHLHQIGQDLSQLSVEELHSRILMLEEEVARLRNEVADKDQTKTAAEALFRRS